MNPALLGGGVAPMKTYFETAYVVRLGVAPSPTPTTHYVTYTGELTGARMQDRERGDLATDDALGFHRDDVCPGAIWRLDLGSAHA